MGGKGTAHFTAGFAELDKLSCSPLTRCTKSAFRRAQIWISQPASLLDLVARFFIACERCQTSTRWVAVALTASSKPSSAR